MHRTFLTSLCVAAILCFGPAAQAQDFHDIIRPDFGDAPRPFRFERFSYGTKAWQRGSIIAAKLPDAPVVIALPPHPAMTEAYVYGYSWFPTFLYDHGYAYATFRAPPTRSAPGDEFASGLAEGVAEVVRQARERGFDGSRLILVGDGWSGLSAALLANDPKYLEQAGVPFSTIKGVLILDGKGLDLAGELGRVSDFTRKQIGRWAPTPEAVRNGSPTDQAAAPNAPHFLFQALRNNGRSAANAAALAEALRQAGADVEIRTVSDAQEARDTDLGNPRSQENDALVGFLARATGRGTATN